MRLSVIIPIYNAEKYLPKCLDELLTCPLLDMECLLINDGSKDSSLHICEAYANKDSRVKVIDKKNEGVSVARNTGLSHATGKYVMFLDADDYMHANKWNEVLEAMELDLDFVAFSYFTLYQDGKVVEEPFHFEAKAIEDIHSIRKILLGTAALNTCWGKLFKLDIIRAYQIQFRAGLKTGEDAIFVLEFLKVANALLLKNESVLFYRQHGESVMHKLDIHSKIQDLRELYSCRKQWVDELNADDLRDVMYREFFSVTTNLLLMFSYKNKLSDCKRVLAQVVKEEMIKEVIKSVNPLELRSFYKRIEFKLLNINNIMLLSSYFKFKSLFLREAGD